MLEGILLHYAAMNVPGDVAPQERGLDYFTFRPIGKRVAVGDIGRPIEASCDSPQSADRGRSGFLFFPFLDCFRLPRAFTV
jgi:hypothetical protein